VNCLRRVVWKWRETLQCDISEALKCRTEYIYTDNSIEFEFHLLCRQWLGSPWRKICIRVSLSAIRLSPSPTSQSALPASGHSATLCSHSSWPLSRGRHGQLPSQMCSSLSKWWAATRYGLHLKTRNLHINRSSMPLSGLQCNCTHCKPDLPLVI